MSVENRKRMYHELVAAGRFKDIDPGLFKEFGEQAEPREPEVVKQPEAAKPNPAIQEPYKKRKR